MEGGGLRQLGGSNGCGDEHTHQQHHQHQQQQHQQHQHRVHQPRRRTRSTGTLPWLNKQSGDSSSSMGEWEISRDVGVSSLYQSDSDDVSGVVQVKRGLYSLQPPRLFPNIESDSVNENFSPVRPITRRKRKLKRMAVMEVDSTAHTPPYSRSLVVSKKKRILRHCENRYCSWVTSGKRKRSSVRACGSQKKRGEEEEAGSTGGGGGATPARAVGAVLALHRLTLGDSTSNSAPPPGVALHQSNSSSLSSSESDPGIYTNDEGREGDDEQSDWVGEASGGGGGHRLPEMDPENDEDEEDMEDDMETGVPPVHLQRHRLSSPDTTMGGGSGGGSGSGGGGGREIRGGRRRIRSDRASFSILTSANEQLSRFLRDPAKSQLRLHPMREEEREELGHLADLYSLDMHLTDHHMGLTCPVLTKTRNTMRAEPVSMSRLHTIGHSKRRRRTPPKIVLADRDII